MKIAEITSGPIGTVADLIDLNESLKVLGIDGLAINWAFRGQPRDY